MKRLLISTLALFKTFVRRFSHQQDEVLTTDPNELDMALERDRASKGAPVGRDAHQETLIRSTKSRQEEADRQAIDRAEDEGMIGHPRQAIAMQREQEVTS